MRTDAAAGGWSAEIDEVLGSDLTAGLAYLTPAGGTVVMAVAPAGLRDHRAGTVSFTTSLGFGRKLQRIRENPRVALAYHAREHGFSSLPLYVLVQGNATVREHDPAALGAIRPNVERFLGPQKTGRLFWDRWLRAYYADRVLVDVAVKRIVAWASLDCVGAPAVHGEALPGTLATAQREPAKGAAPRVPVERAARRLARLPHRLVAAAGADGHPFVLPFAPGAVRDDGIGLNIAGPGLCPGGRRAGVLAHSYRPRLVGLEARQHTGWLNTEADGKTGVYAPHTEQGFVAPPNKTLLLLVNGFMARRGLRRAEAMSRSH